MQSQHIIFNKKIVHASRYNFNETAYTVMVQPHLEYGNVVWHPQLKQNVELLEAVQHRDTKMIPGQSHLSYEERLKRMGLPSLSYRRLRGDAIETFKHLHGFFLVESTSHHQNAAVSTTYRGCINAWSWVETAEKSLQNVNMSECSWTTHCELEFVAGRFSYMWLPLWSNCFKGRFARYCAKIQYCTQLSEDTVQVKTFVFKISLQAIRPNDWIWWWWSNSFKASKISVSVPIYCTVLSIQKWRQYRIATSYRIIMGLELAWIGCVLRR